MQRPLTFARHYWQHIQNCLTVRKLLRENPGRHINGLYWYDLPIGEAVRWSGILKAICWGLKQPPADEIAGNYGLISLYRAEPPEKPVDVSNPPVWNCRSLNSKPWFDEFSETRQLLESNADAIIAEFNAVRHRIGDHPDNGSLTPRGRWTGMFLFGTEGKNEELAARCPVTTRTIECLSLCTNFGFVMFSGTEPGTHIAPHCGSSNLRQRTHIGVEVPEPDACKIRVGTEWRQWRQGKTISFDDSFEHEVIHDGKLDRVVLSIDTWHPELDAADIRVLGHPVFQKFGYARAEDQRDALA